jgi:hypothetical protein
LGASFRIQAKEALSIEILRLLVRGTDYAPYIDISSNPPTATDQLEKNQNGMTFTVYLNGEVDPPRAGMEVVWQRYDLATSTETAREFAGVLTRVREKVEGATLVYECEATSYIRWFDRRLVNGFTQQQRADTTIQSLVNEYCAGFDASEINVPIVVPSLRFEYQRPSNCIKAIVDQIGYGWYIDYYRNLHVYRLEELDSPLPNGILDIDNDLTNYGDLEIEEDAEKIFNRFTLRGFKMRSDTPFPFYFRGDGTTTQWSLGYRVSSAKGDVTCTVGGVEYDVKKDVLDGIPGQGGEEGVMYIHYTQHLIRFASPPPDGAQIVVTTYPLIDRWQGDQDDESVEYMATLEATESGIYEYAEVDKALTQSTGEAIRSKLQLLATKYGFPTIAARFHSYASGWLAGQSFTPISTRRMGGMFTGDDRWYVWRVQKTWIQAYHGGPAQIRYDVDCADKPYLL